MAVSRLAICKVCAGERISGSRKLRAAWKPRIYVLTRYIGIASQMYVRSRSPCSASRDTHALRLNRFNVGFTARMYLGVPTSPTGCHIWFLFQALVVQFLLAFTEAVLMHRRTFHINPQSPAHPQVYV